MFNPQEAELLSALYSFFLYSFTSLFVLKCLLDLRSFAWLLEIPMTCEIPVIFSVLSILTYEISLFSVPRFGSLASMISGINSRKDSTDSDTPSIKDAKDSAAFDSPVNHIPKPAASSFDPDRFYGNFDKRVDGLGLAMRQAFEDVEPISMGEFDPISFDKYFSERSLEVSNAGFLLNDLLSGYYKDGDDPNSLERNSDRLTRNLLRALVSANMRNID
ncbi:hypothetical protein DL96DRAFT_773769 [Flagelloscypha sp. PMI_526]|nr:hypothetical protein DL96DRAFT_773769 [Flagelloscypha sp. PMI_526]